MHIKPERFLTFFLDNHLCAFKVSDVREINHPSLSNDAPHALLRDETIQTFDLRKRLGLETKSVTQASRMIVVKSPSKNTATLVDSIHTVIDLYADQWESLTTGDTLPFPNSSVFAGIATWKGQTVLLLDIVRVIEAGGAQDIAS